MNNPIFPKYEEGETLGYLVASHMRQPERKVWRSLNVYWEVMIDRCERLCDKRAGKLVDFFTNLASQLLPKVFIDPVDSELLSKKIEDWSERMRPIFLNEFKQFSLAELEDFTVERFTSDPFLESLKKEQEVVLDNAEEIAKIGAGILTEILFSDEDIPIPDFTEPETVAESIADLELKRYAEGLIAGTVKRFQVANQQRFFYDKKYLAKLEEPKLLRNLFVRLTNTFRTTLVEGYEAKLSQKDLRKVLEKRSQTLYRTVDEKIYRDLQLKSIEWITLQGLN